MTKRMKTMLSLLTLAAGLSALSCTTIAEKVAENLAKKRFKREAAKEFEVHIQRADAYRKCLDTRQGICEVALTLTDLSVETYYKPTSPLDTSVTRYDLGVQLGATAEVLRQSASADIAAEALEHTVQRQLNALYNAMSGFHRGGGVQPAGRARCDLFFQRSR